MKIQNLRHNWDPAVNIYVNISWFRIHLLRKSRLMQNTTEVSTDSKHVHHGTWAPKAVSRVCDPRPAGDSWEIFNSHWWTKSWENGGGGGGRRERGKTERGGRPRESMAKMTGFYRNQSWGWRGLGKGVRWEEWGCWPQGLCDSHV